MKKNLEGLEKKFRVQNIVLVVYNDFNIIYIFAQYWNPQIFRINKYTYTHIMRISNAPKNLR